MAMQKTVVDKLNWHKIDVAVDYILKLNMYSLCKTLGCHVQVLWSKSKHERKRKQDCSYQHSTQGCKGIVSKGEDHNLKRSKAFIVVEGGYENVGRIRDESASNTRHVPSYTCYPKLLNLRAILFGPLKNLVVEKIHGMLKCRKH